MPHQQPQLSEALLGHFNVMINKGDVSDAGDFPAAGEAQNGWFYAIQDTVTDPVTGRTFNAGEYIVWNGTDWYIIQSGSSAGLRIVGPVTILAGDTEDVDVIVTPRVSVWYVFHVYESVDERHVTMQIQAVHSSGAPGSFTHAIPVEVGDRMRVTPDTSIVGSDLVLKFTNNQSNPITVVGKAIDI